MNAAVAEGLLLFVLLPAWVMAGAADWVCHSRTAIERTAGWRESALHLLLLGIAGFPVLLGLLFEINGAVLLLMLGSFILHEVVGYLDVRYAARVRYVGPLEQKLHDYMVAVPVAGLALITVMHGPAALSVLSLGAEPFDPSLRPKADPVPVGLVAGIMAAILLLNGVPYLVEFVRGVRAARLGQATLPHRNERPSDRFNR